MVINPKISIISTIYNRGKFLLRFLISIQFQNFYDLEIILIDDHSQDNSVELINGYKKKEKRIKLIKNSINKGTFICRNLGAIYSKGKYIIFPDPDDILSKNIINLCYKYAKKYDYEIIKFNIYIGKYKMHMFNLNNYFENRPIYQPELSTYMFYGNNNELERIDANICNKFIKKKVFIKALNSLKNNYLNMFIKSEEDQLITYILYRNAESFLYLKKIGYYYITNSLSITKNSNKISSLALLFHYIYLKSVFDNTKNNKYEKDIVNFLFIFYIKRNLSNLKKYFSFFKEVININLNCTFITEENKHLLKKFKYLLKNKIKKYIL